MKKILFFISPALLIVAFYACKVGQGSIKLNLDDLYKTWVVDTVIISGADNGATPNIETDKNEYQFKKDGTNPKQGIRTTFTSEASFEVHFTLKNGRILFDSGATFPLLKFDGKGNLVSSNMNVPLPPYKIVELSADKLILQNSDIVVRLRAK